MKLGCLVVSTVVVFFLALSWLITCGIIKLITLCFSLQFSLAAATGIWLILLLISSFFKAGSSRDK